MAGESGIRAFAAVIILETHDIVFAEVVTALHFDDVHGVVRDIGNSVNIANGNICGLVDAQVEFSVIQRDACLSAHYGPVFRAPCMFLQRQNSPRIDYEAFYLSSVVLIQTVVAAPGTKHLAV